MNIEWLYYDSNSDGLIPSNLAEVRRSPQGLSATQGRPQLHLSRSRPYRKNDNRFVEQKNATLVRAYVGYKRLDTPTQCTALNALYDQLWVYYNLFQPVLHLVGKEVVDGKLRRQWDQAQTPYQRLLASSILSSEQQARLAILYAETNPRRLREAIYQALERLWQRPKPALSPAQEAPQAPNRKEAATTLR